MAAGKAQTVLVVEDEASIASFVSLYLKNAGYTVRTASTGQEALSQAQSGDVALTVLDLMLPDIDGIEVCRRIRKTSDMPILMLTARDEDVDKIIGLEVGADDYLTKPFNPRELVARVKSILRRSAPERRERESAHIRHGDLLVDAVPDDLDAEEAADQLETDAVAAPARARRRELVRLLPADDHRHAAVVGVRIVDDDRAAGAMAQDGPPSEHRHRAGGVLDRERAVATIARKRRRRKGERGHTRERCQKPPHLRLSIAGKREFGLTAL